MYNLEIKDIFLKMFWIIIGLFVTQIPVAFGLEYGIIGKFVSYFIAVAVGLLLDYKYSPKRDDEDE